jgi:hypothetical protein
MPEQLNTAKEILNQIAIQVITTVAEDKTLTGQQKQEKVVEFIANLDNATFAGVIPDYLEEAALNYGIDKLQEFVKLIDIPSFVKKNYLRVRTLLKKLFRRED